MPLAKEPICNEKRIIYCDVTRHVHVTETVFADNLSGSWKHFYPAMHSCAIFRNQQFENTLLQIQYLFQIQYFKFKLLIPGGTFAKDFTLPVPTRSSLLGGWERSSRYPTHPALGKAGRSPSTKDYIFLTKKLIISCDVTCRAC